jgi:hypothetical protein
LRLLFRPYNLNTPSPSGILKALKASKIHLEFGLSISRHHSHVFRFEATQAAQTQFEEHLNAPPALNSFVLEWPSPSADGSARSLFIDAPVFAVGAALAPTSLRFLEEAIPARAGSVPSM